MQSTGGRNYKKEFVHRAWDFGVTDDVFIEEFYVGKEVERNLRSEDNRGNFDEELDFQAEQAKDNYERFWLASRAHIRTQDTRKGTIKPKKRWRAGKSKDVAGIWERQEALAQYLAGIASEDKPIVDFRNHVLSGQILSEEQAVTFLSSPLAAASNKPSRFKRRCIEPLDKILNTNYEVEDGQDEWGPFRKLVWEHGDRYQIRPLLVTRRLLYAGDHATQDDLRVVRRVNAIVFPHPRVNNRFVLAARDSFIGQLADLVEKRMTGYPISREMGVWFILTGEFVHQAPVRIRYMTTRWPDVVRRTTITLEVESWLPPEEVLKQYTHAQQEILGKTPRSLKRKTLDVFKLVNEHRAKPWSKLLQIWNREHPRDGFKYRSHLFDTYARAFELLTGVELITAEQLEADTSLKVLGTASHGLPIFADKWYLLHEDTYTGTFDSREEAEADPRRTSTTEVVTSKQLLTRLAEREDGDDT